MTRHPEDTISDTLWRGGGVSCVMVHVAVGTAVELGTEQGSTRKPFPLMVEDEQDTADACREALRFSGVRAPTVPIGRNAVRRGTELQPDLIILDYRLHDVQPSLLPTLLAAARLLRRRVLPAPPRSPGPPA
jgi:hypothetical protein